jgi:tRNA modification GTPase
MFDIEDTICALATAPGRSGIAVVRISGAESFAILRRIFPPAKEREELPPRSAVLGEIVDPGSGESIDQALVTCFPSPHSYTGEDVAEISIHGSPVVASFLLDALCRCGARIAQPGEFTMRAFLRGRLDLVQAEAVRDIVEASTLYQVRVASRQRTGELSGRLQPVKELLIDIIVNLESAVEFVEEDLEPESREVLAERLERVLGELCNWIQSFRRGRIVREGFSLAIVGRPNVGKSSLFNVLLAQERSIVTEVPGTTRDLVSEVTSLEGIPLKLVDTAGVRATADRVERVGVDRSYRAMVDADAILLVVDTSSPPESEDFALLEHLSGLPFLVAMNKSDLESVWSREQKDSFSGIHKCLEVSALTGSGVEALRQAILTHLFGGSRGENDGILVTSLRHCHCLEASRENLQRAATALRQSLSEEFVLLDLHAALKNLGMITGETGVEEILGEIFSRFCVGK